MTDSFALLGLPRTAVLDEAVLQARWHVLSRAAHPDMPGGDAARAGEINAAYETLASPEKRLRHLLELHSVPWRAIPIRPELMDLFMKVGAEVQNVAAFTQKRQKASSAIAKALLAPEEMRLRERLEALNEQVECLRRTELEHLAGVDADLELHLASLQATQAALAYLGKWQSQIREALLALI